MQMTVSEMESALPQAKDGATLWETEEQAVRFILEDGKLNVCLRSIIHYKRYIRDSKNDATAQLEIIENKTKSTLFEKSLGSVLHSAWLHIEAIQTTDLPFLIEHISEVLDNAVEKDYEIVKELHNDGNLRQSQEIMVLLYLGIILKHLEILREERIMPFIRQRNIFVTGMKLLHHLHHANMINEDVCLKILTTLSTIVETEDFTTYRDKYIVADDLDLLLDFKTNVLTAVQSTLPRDKRNLFRPLSDCIDKFKRSISSSLSSSRK